MHKVYVGVGGNVGDSVSVLQAAFDRIACLRGLEAFKSSQLYLTSPVSLIPQGAYTNAVCSFTTTLSSSELFAELQKIETDLGKTPKNKDQPRMIDLDILFFGLEYRDDAELQLPHPRWKERLFVLVPLLELTFTVAVPNRNDVKLIDLCQLAKDFKNIHNETIRMI